MTVVFLLLVLHAGLASAEDTVGEDIGVHQLERLVELLTPEDCEGLLAALSHPEENIFRHVERLSPEKNDLRLQLRAKRSVDVSIDSEEECRAALSDWLHRYGRQIYYDRLSRALQHIGRTDIAIEVGKNVNQDKAVRLRRFVGDLRKHAASLNIPPIRPDADAADGANKPDAQQRIRKREVKDLTPRDLNLIVERFPAPPSQQRGLQPTLPLLYGLLLGFGGNLLLCLLTLALKLGRGRSWRC